MFITGIITQLLLCLITATVLVMAMQMVPIQIFRYVIYALWLHIVLLTNPTDEPVTQ